MSQMRRRDFDIDSAVRNYISALAQNSEEGEYYRGKIVAELEEIKTYRKKWPYKRDEKPEIISEALKRIIRDYED